MLTSTKGHFELVSRRFHAASYSFYARPFRFKRLVYNYRLTLQCRDVNIIKMEHHSEEYQKINPMRTVPVLKDGDFILSESHAILKYLLTQYGNVDTQEELYPGGARARGLVDQAMFFNSGYFFRRFMDVAGPTLSGQLTSPSAQHVRSMEDAYGAVEAYLQGRAYVAADRLTLADLSVGSTATAAQVLHKLDRDRYPRFADWMNRLEEKPYFKSINAEGVAYFSKIINHAWKQNKLKASSK